MTCIQARYVGSEKKTRISYADEKGLPLSPKTHLVGIFLIHLKVNGISFTGELFRRDADNVLQENKDKHQQGLKTPISASLSGLLSARGRTVSAQIGAQSCYRP